MTKKTQHDPNLNKLESLLAQMHEVSDVVGWTFVGIVWSYAARFCGLKTRLIEFEPRGGEHKEEDLATIKRWEERLDDYTNILSYAAERANTELMSSPTYLVETFVKPNTVAFGGMPDHVAEAFQEHAELDDEEMAVFNSSLEKSAMARAETQREALIRHKDVVAKDLKHAMETPVGAFELTDVDTVALLNLVAERCNRYRFSKLKMAANQRRIEQQLDYIAEAKLLKGLQPTAEEAAHQAEQALEVAGREVMTGQDVDGREQTAMH